ELSPRSFAGELHEEIAQTGNYFGVRFLDVEKERPRDRVGSVGNRIEGRLHVINCSPSHLVRILVEKAEAKYAKRTGVCLQLLHDEVVVLAGFDERTVLPK